MIKEKLKYFNYLRTTELGIRFQKGVFWNAIGIVISRFFLIISSIVVARILGRETFGELGIIQSTVSMFGVFAGLGLGITTTKYLAEYKISNPAKAGRIISLTNLLAFIGSGIVSFLLFMFSQTIASLALAAPELNIYIKYSSILLFFSTLNGVQIGTLTGLEKFKEISKINTLNGLLNFSLLIVLTYCLSLAGSVWALNISIIITFILSQLLVRKELKKINILLKYSACWIEKTVLWKFSVPAFLAGSLVGPVNWICNAILVNHQNGYAEMGIYNAANQWFSVLLFLPGIVGSTILPILTEKVANVENKRAEKILKYSIYMNVIIILPFLLLFSIFSSFIMSMYGKKFSGTEMVLIYTLITAGLYAIQMPVGNLIIAKGKMWVGFVFNLLWGLTFMFFTDYLIKLGAEGISLARLIAYGTLLIATTIYSFKLFQKQRWV